MKAIYPIDPQGGGTWLAVNQQGLSLALLNNYQANEKIKQQSKLYLSKQKKIISRGQLILSLLRKTENTVEQLKSMDLTAYQPFQLCIFPENLSAKSKKIECVNWDGCQLVNSDAVQPITSSSVDFIKVEKNRKKRFIEIINANKPELEQYKAYHFSKSTIGKNSVNMERKDARTVSISHVSVRDKISFSYFDSNRFKYNTTSCDRVIYEELALKNNSELVFNHVYQ